MINQTASQILVVDDDEAICKTLAAILKAEGYQTATATTAKEAIEKTKTTFYNIALLDIKLPDMEGTQLLAQLQGITPETIKIMITGYPSLKNAVEALNLGANSYIMKPIDPAELLETIKNKLDSQREAEKITKEKIVKWIQTQTRKRQSTDFANFLEETAKELADLGLTKTQAKIYITLIALGIGSVAEIAALSKIRREEVYRIIPELEKHGIITKKLVVPRKFSAVPPETALQLLIRTKLKALKEETDRLEQRQADLISRLKAINSPIKQDNCSMEVLSKHEYTIMRLIEMTENAKQKIDLITSLEELKMAYINRTKELRRKLLKTVKMRIIIQSCETDSFTSEIVQSAKAQNNTIELRQIDKLPFNLIIADDAEAMWGDRQPKNGSTHAYWTDDTTQISILKTSFENLWQKATQQN